MIWIHRFLKMTSSPHHFPDCGSETHFIFRADCLHRILGRLGGVGESMPNDESERAPRLLGSGIAFVCISAYVRKPTQSKQEKQKQ